MKCLQQDRNSSAFCPTLVIQLGMIDWAASQMADTKMAGMDWLNRMF